MITFIVSICLLILGYIIYGGVAERLFKPDKNLQTPAYTKADGVDYLAMPTWKVFMIQFLNIAGTGPIFGAIMGAKFGPSCYLWIVFGCIFAGAVHDYLSGMLSLRHGGADLPSIIGYHLGEPTRKVMLVFCMLLLLLVGAVFVYSPAVILGSLTGGTRISMFIWVIVIFAYYIIATCVPINKIIGKIYPIFAICMIFMAVALMVCLFVKWPSLPEIWEGLQNRGPSVGMNNQPILPYLFITIACGAVSGFHATQSPLMARCTKNEKYGRPIFYGSMITEGIIALIWATVSSYFFFDGGAEEVGLAINASAPEIVNAVSLKWLGALGGVLALIGVVAAPITTGDTALRSARLIVADAFKINQTKVSSRLKISIPIFIVTGVFLWFNMSFEDGFNIIWRYFGWANQTLACFTLWAVTVWLANRRPSANYLISLIPAAFMTAICTTYICIAKIGLNMPDKWSPYISAFFFALSLFLFFDWLRRKRAKLQQQPHPQAPLAETEPEESAQPK